MMRSMFRLCSLSILLCLFLPSRGTHSGTVVRVNQEALEYVCQEGKPFLLKGLRVIQIPNFQKSGSIFGIISNVVGIRILDVQLPHLSVKLVPRRGVQLSLSSHFYIGASLVQLRLDSSIVLDVGVTRSPHSSPALTVSACKSILGDVKILVGGTNLFGFLDPLKEHIRTILMDKMCLSVSATILGLNVRLQSLVGLNSFNPRSNFQYSMKEPLDITSDYIDLDLNVAFALMGKPIEAPGPVPMFSLPPQKSGSDTSMVNMGISEHFFANIFATLKESGALNLNIGGQQRNGKGHLTVSLLQSAMPQITRRYSQNAALKLKISVQKIPTIKLQERVAILRLAPSIQVLVAVSQSSSQTQVLCTLGLDLSLSLKLDVTATELRISAALQGAVGLQVASSQIKVEQISHLRNVLVPLVEEAFLVHLNALLSVGISLPKVSRVQYVNPQIEIHQGYAQVNSDLECLP